MSDWCAVRGSRTVPHAGGQPQLLQRRQWLLGNGISTALMGCGLLTPQALWAAEKEISFDTVLIPDALRAMGAIQADARHLNLIAPDVAEDGALVPVSVECWLPGTREIFIVVDSNPDPLAAQFSVPEGTEAFVATRIKMAGDGTVYAVVRAQGRIYVTSQAMKVTVGGCG